MNVFLIILLVLVLLLAVYEAFMLVRSFIKMRKKNQSKEKKVVREYDTTGDEKGNN